VKGSDRLIEYVYSTKERAPINQKILTHGYGSDPNLLSVEFHLKRQSSKHPQTRQRSCPPLREKDMALAGPSRRVSRQLPRCRTLRWCWSG
jgi:hypothetical protein